MQNSRGTFEGGAVTGVRFFLPRNWYIEVFARSGYPYLAGGGLVVGLRIPNKRNAPVEVEKIVEVPVEVEKLVEVEKIVEVEVPVEVEKLVEVEKVVEIEVPVEVEKIVEVEVIVEVEKIIEIEKKIAETFTIFFGPDSASLRPETLFREVRQHNDETFVEVVKLLKENPDCRLLVEGNANPVTKNDDEEQTELNPLSRRRAQEVFNQLISRGIDKKRFILFGSGGERAIPPVDYLPSGTQNRRVDLYVIR
ncbi:hypothetical protein AGMMS49944_26500 [Spirochaetia bacterium]|nr:hypothetical protein AGMMS49944_26500 [Spirochaetia bacterium]